MNDMPNWPLPRQSLFSRFSTGALTVVACATFLVAMSQHSCDRPADRNPGEEVPADQREPRPILPFFKHNEAENTHP